MATNNEKDVQFSDSSKFLNQSLHLDRRDEPNNLKELCFDLLKKFRPKYVTNITKDQIDVQRIAGGYSNQTYRCKILVPIGSDPAKLYEQDQFVVRLYGAQFYFAGFDPKCPRLKDEILSLLASEKGVGPKLYGLFSEGQIQKYYPSRNFELDDLNNNDLIKQSAIKLAQFHAMEPPIVYKNWSKQYLFSMEKQLFDPFLSAKRPEKYRKYGCTSLLEIDLKSEFDWIIKTIQNSGSPIVFGHNDFRFGNIMVTEDKQIFLCDFELSYYSNRGFDFANFFVSADKSKQLPYQFQNETVVKQFIVEYVKQNELIYGKQYSVDKNNSVEHILREAKLFSMVFAFNFVCGFILMHDDPNKLAGLEHIFDEKTSKILANAELDKYFMIKKQLTKLNLI